MNIIVAACKNRGIGYKNLLPWHIPSELKYFKCLTLGKGNNAVIMGKNTWKSLKKPLPKRDNYVLSSTIDENEKPYILRNIDHLDILLDNNNYDNIWLIGGEQIYNSFIYTPYVKSIYYTYIDENFTCDTYFPEIPNNFKEVFRSNFYKENGLNYNFNVFDNVDLKFNSNSVKNLKECLNYMNRLDYKEIVKHQQELYKEAYVFK